MNTSQTGTYILSYLRVDTAGNLSNVVNRTVNVLLMSDNIAPIVTIVGSQNINIVQGSTYADSGATWTDNVDGSGTLVASGSVNTAIPGYYTLLSLSKQFAGVPGYNMYYYTLALYSLLFFSLLKYQH